jgi:predicted heme/steroid binding protein
MRISNFEQLYTTRFGIILSIKIILFSLMVAVAVVTTFFIREKLMEKRRQQKTDHDHPKDLCHTELLSFDGTGSSPTYVGADKEVYDVSESPAWKDGRHMAQHFAGRDLSEALLNALHGREVLLKFKKVGRVWERPTEAQLPVTPVGKAFFILAKSALVISFLILFCVALWRWG